jgi:hypothetical protein
MIAFHADGNLILQQALKSKSDCHQIAAYNAIMTRLAARGLSVDLQILNNKASAKYKEAITFKWNTKFQLVPPDMHCQNRAECAILTFKDHFLAILAGINSAFPPYLWDLLLPQTAFTLNLLRQATLNPRISAWEFFQGPFNFNNSPLATGSKNCSRAILSCGTTLHSTTHTKHNHNHSRAWKYDEPWWPPSHHGHHSAPPPAPRHKTCSQHALQQYYVVKTRQSYHY